MILLIVAAGAMFWMSSRQRKKQREAVSFIDTLAPGARIMTASGYVGTVVATTDTEVVLESFPGEGRTTWVKAAIRSQVTEEPAETAESDVSVDATPTVADEDIVVPDYVSKLIDKRESGDTKK